MNPIKFIEWFRWVQYEVHATAVSKLWWQQRDEIVAVLHQHRPDLAAAAKIQIDIACLALVMTECAEAIEAIRHGNPPDDKIPQFDGAVAEMADAVIRLMDVAECRGWPLAEAIVAKAEMNKTRAPMHGGKKA